MDMTDDLPGGADDGEATKVISADQVTLKQEMAKAKEQEACLILIRGTPQGHRYFLTQPEIIIGRDPAADISIVENSISRKHVKIARQGEKHTITDLGSSNGTYVNDKKLEANQPRELTKEDMIRVGGNAIFKYLPAGELETMFYGSLSDAAHTDALTRIYNKRYLLDALESEFKRAKGLHSEFSVLFFDLDHFKKVNDTHGHDAGDYVLREFATLVRTGHIRPKDIFARYGGEEFVVLLANTSGKDAADIGERIRAAIEAHAFIYEGKRLPITTSMGVAELRTGIESSATLLKAADTALYAAKSGGRNKVVVAS